MAILTILHRRRFYEVRLPHLVFIDGLYAGTMRGDEMQVQLPAGRYQVRVQFGGPISLGRSGKRIDLSVSSTRDDVEVKRAATVAFHDRERLWNLLFDVDLLVWIVSLFIPLSRGYKIVSDAFFAIWLIRLIFIRKRYYKLNIKQ